MADSMKVLLLMEKLMDLLGLSISSLHMKANGSMDKWTELAKAFGKKGNKIIKK